MARRAERARHQDHHTTGVRLRVRGTILALGAPCDTCRDAIAAEGIQLAPIAHLADVGPTVHARVDTRAVLVLERSPTEPPAVQDLVLLHRAHRDLSLGYIATRPDDSTRATVLRVGARYLSRDDHKFVRNLRSMAVSLAIASARIDALLHFATEAYGLDDTEQRLLRFYLRGAPVAHIAEGFRIGVDGVNYHKKKLLRKANAASVEDLVQRLLALELA